MEYLLDGIVHYNNDLRTLTDNKHTVELSLATSRLLNALIDANNRQISRTELLEKVWEEHGLVASDNNLNRNISLLRKAFLEFSLEDKIETIPKQGFVLHCKCTPVNPISSNTREKLKNIYSSNKSFHISTIILTFLILSTFGTFYLNHANNSNLHKYKSVGLCDVFSDVNVIKQENIDAFFNTTLGQKIALQCTKKTSIIYFDDNRAPLKSMVYSTHIAVCGKVNTGKGHECENYVNINNN
ncbi:winged helix-turn-helix domain-containing protein [Enterobacter asburiae]|uniref:winged helix-turn-helix domain-containing protein n=1 Tax=Enterobacter asburiae TaxID=61645 RepID=UPI000ADBC624|nr:winged helix-turn-helix domain-containing protein [Enterobacter asburiae]MCB4614590.1 winged helix-turn-helix domain-containing protein [Enterobacter asburiae]